ncbi:MAG: PQQ-binding-like beta-propeller repeat protein [Bacteroidota bacterium]
MRKIVFLSLFLIFSNHLTAQEISQWRGKNRDGKYHETGLLKKWPTLGPKLLWHYDKLGDGHASAAVTKNKVYTSGTSGTDGFVIAFDHSGKTLWKTIYGKEWIESYEGVRTTPLIYNDKLYVMSGYGKVVCMNANNGKIIWDVELQKDYDGRNIVWGVTENLLIDGEKLICTPGGISANVIALNKNTGKLIWKSKGNGEKSAYCSPTLIKLQKHKIIVTMTERSILGIDASNGKLLWKHPQTNQYSVHANTPLYRDGYLYCVSGYGKGGVQLKLSSDGSNVKEVWRNSSLDTRMGGVVLIGNHLYGSGDYSRKWVSLDWKTGNELDSSRVLKNGNLIYADGMLYCYDQAGYVALVEPKKGSYNLISKFKVPYGYKQHWSHLVIYNKRLYVRHGTSLMVYYIGN